MVNWKIGDVGIFKDKDTIERFRITGFDKKLCIYDIEILNSIPAIPERDFEPTLSFWFKKNSRYANEAKLDEDYLLDLKLGDL